MRTIYLDALKNKKHTHTPMWIMRQAGRYLPEYRYVRSKFQNFMTMCKNAQACCEVALQPLDRFDLDASIVFSDILTIPEAMGMKLEFIPGTGPVFDNPIQSDKQISLLDTKYAIDKLTYVYDAVSTTKQAIKNRVPLIGFCGSPWTLAAYMVEGHGSKQFTKLRQMMYAQPKMLQNLLDKLTQVTCIYLSEQIKSGADAIMIFDTWGGLLSHHTYQIFSLNYMQTITQFIKTHHPDTPVTLFTKGGGLWLDKIAQSGCDAAGIDWSISIKQARGFVNDSIALQGNLDPAALYGSDESIIQEVKAILSTQRDNHRYIFNLGHGVYPDINPDKVKVMVEAVREFGCKNQS
ncbi:uroporphyrinogen decarboxylase [Facilibium subflavum]|uniref:uroporphyrinogen decarboxylase n=1 Tax=Facilibium subflavum TaxID=2219058 RepID=UPI000E64C30D|nr:uroporphyrinogen decarboxylase [Facilibium subflavum]